MPSRFSSVNIWHYFLMFPTPFFPSSFKIFLLSTKKKKDREKPIEIRGCGNGWQQSRLQSGGKNNFAGTAEQVFSWNTKLSLRPQQKMPLCVERLFLAGP